MAAASSGVIIIVAKYQQYGVSWRAAKISLAASKAIMAAMA